MKVEVTLDYYDGSKGRAKQVYIDEIDSFTLKMSMMQSGVCGVTITKANTSLEKIVNKTRGECYEYYE
jgi:hypothetical protein